LNIVLNDQTSIIELVCKRNHASPAFACGRKCERAMQGAGAKGCRELKMRK